ncbi:type IV secretion system protein VirB10 [Sphingomonas gellani]|uniref:Type IV secretion system protein VirB10 n=1 Tax=Sphingomonas gellani TaxID=1166340 RepID=A0A1H8JCS7_9SPHN|nr:TrbI/VirB10 family protein [Sphingomonas gellani]SEN78017.1 type IV secretion system protein VirB10 [Sphingomonas gellani]
MSTTTLERSAGLVPFIAQEDPRESLDNQALVAASTNGFPIVATRVARRDRAGLAAGAAGAILLGGLTFWSISGPAPQPRAPAVRPAPPIKVAAPIAPPATIPVPPATPAQEVAIARVIQPATAPRTGIDAAHAPVMVWDTSGAPEIAAAAPAAPVPGAPAKVTAPQPLSENESFASRMGEGTGDVATATRIVNPANTVTQGTLIPAVLETAIDSDLPGYARAVVSQDVRSFDGSRVLVPRSSRLIGQYKSGFAAGQTRAYVMWTRLIRPDGVTVQLASPAIEFSGASGLTGEVNSHFMKRFGAAGLLSVIGGLGALATGGTSLVLSGGSSAASVAAQRDAQIPPTIRIGVGQPIRVFTARDLDFSIANGSIQP